MPPKPAKKFKGKFKVIKKLPAKEKPVEKKKPKFKVVKKAPEKKKASQFNYNELTDNEKLLFRDEEEVESNIANSNDISWISGVSDSMSKFYLENAFRDELSEKKQNRMDKIQDKINEGMRPSLEKRIKKSMKEWKIKNKDKTFTLKQAQDSFDKYYF